MQPQDGVLDAYVTLRDLLADREVATVLLALGLLGLAIELALPGLLIPAILGGLALLLAFAGFLQLPSSPAIVLITAAAFAGFVLIVVHAALQARRGAVRTGIQALVGQRGVATTRVAPVGTVSVGGEAWSARADTRAIAPGEAVSVVGVEGVTLRVRAVEALPP